MPIFSVNHNWILFARSTNTARIVSHRFAELFPSSAKLRLVRCHNSTKFTWNKFYLCSKFSDS